MACGRAARCTVPLAAWIVTGNGAAAPAGLAATRGTTDPTKAMRETAAANGARRNMLVMRDHPPSLYGGRSAPDPTPDGGIERTALPPRTGVVDSGQAAGLAPVTGSLTIAGQRRILTGL